MLYVELLIEHKRERESRLVCRWFLTITWKKSNAKKNRLLIWVKFICIQLPFAWNVYGLSHLYFWSTSTSSSRKSVPQSSFDFIQTLLFFLLIEKNEKICYWLILIVRHFLHSFRFFSSLSPFSISYLELFDNQCVIFVEFYLLKELT